MRGQTCICAWCNGRGAEGCPVIRIPVQPIFNIYNLKTELRTLLEYLRRKKEYIDEVIAGYEVTNTVDLPPVVDGKKRSPRRRLCYVLHTCHFLRVVPGVGKQSAKLIPFVSVQDIIDNGKKRCMPKQMWRR